MFLLFAQTFTRWEGVPHVMVNILGLAPLAAFQVTVIGCFWPIPQGKDDLSHP